MKGRELREGRPGKLYLRNIVHTWTSSHTQAPALDSVTLAYSHEGSVLKARTFEVYSRCCVPNTKNDDRLNDSLWLED